MTLEGGVSVPAEEKKNVSKAVKKQMKRSIKSPMRLRKY